MPIAFGELRDKLGDPGRGFRRGHCALSGAQRQWFVERLVEHFLQVWEDLCFVPLHASRIATLSSLPAVFLRRPTRPDPILLIGFLNTAVTDSRLRALARG